MLLNISTIQIEMENFEQKYNNLLIQFNKYREQVLLEKQAQLQEFQKYRSILDKTYKQIEKKYEAKLQEERLSFDKKLKKQQQSSKGQQQQLELIIENKNKFIEQLKRRLIQSEQQKHQIIEDNTKMLYQLCQDIENEDQNRGPGQNKYQDLVRLYQFVLEQNNTLKKEIVKVELKSRQLGVGQGKADGNSRVVAIKEQKKKKKTNSSFENSKLHNQSIKSKLGVPPKKDAKSKKPQN